MGKNHRSSKMREPRLALYSIPLGTIISWPVRSIPTNLEHTLQSSRHTAVMLCCIEKGPKDALLFIYEGPDNLIYWEDIITGALTI